MVFTPKNPDHPLVRAILRCLELNADATLDSIAIKLKKSPYHLSHVFSELSGINYRTARLWIKLRSAPDELAKGRSSEDLSLELGYKSAWGFEKSMTRVHGKSPAQFRTKKKKTATQ